MRRGLKAGSLVTRALENLRAVRRIVKVGWPDRSASHIGVRREPEYAANRPEHSRALEARTMTGCAAFDRQFGFPHTSGHHGSSAPISARACRRKSIEIGRGGHRVYLTAVYAVRLRATTLLSAARQRWSHSTDMRRQGQSSFTLQWICGTMERLCPGQWKIRVGSSLV